MLQAAVLKKYSAQLSLATLICFLGTLQATVISLAVVRDPSQWALGWDINLLAAVYAVRLAFFFSQGKSLKYFSSVFEIELRMAYEGKL